MPRRIFLTLRTRSVFGARAGCTPGATSRPSWTGRACRVIALEVARLDCHRDQIPDAGCRAPAEAAASCRKSKPDAMEPRRCSRRAFKIALIAADGIGEALIVAGPDGLESRRGGTGASACRSSRSGPRTSRPASLGAVASNAAALSRSRRGRLRWRASGRGRTGGGRSASPAPYCRPRVGRRSPRGTTRRRGSDPAG